MLENAPRTAVAANDLRQGRAQPSLKLERHAQKFTLMNNEGEGCAAFTEVGAPGTESGPGVLRDAAHVWNEPAGVLYRGWISIPTAFEARAHHVVDQT